MEKCLFCMLFFTVSICMASCNHVQKQKDGEPEQNDSLKEAKQLRDEYNFLTTIGIYRWDDIDDYIDYIRIDSNRKSLKEELKAEGLRLWDDIYCRQDLCSKRKKGDISVSWDKSYQKWLYVQLRSAGVAVGTLFDFVDNLKDMDKCVFYYKKSREMGLVDNWEHFMMRLFEADCDSEYCQEYYREYYLDKWIEEYYNN